MPRLTFALGFQIKLVVISTAAFLVLQLITTFSAMFVSVIICIGLIVYFLVTIRRKRNEKFNLERVNCEVDSTDLAIVKSSIVSTFKIVASHIDIIVSKCDYSVKVEFGKKKSLPRIRMTIPSSSVAAFADGIVNPTSDYSNRFLSILAHELGHVVYRDQSRLGFLYICLSFPFIWTLIAAKMIADGTSYGVGICFMFLELCIALALATSCIMLLRDGEYYADAFSAKILGRDCIHSALSAYARHEKFIRFPWRYRITHPSLSSRLEILTRPRILLSQIITISLFSFASFTLFAVGVPVAVISNFTLWVVAVALAYGIPFLSFVFPAIALMAFAWVIFCLMAPVGHLGAELGAGSSARAAMIALLSVFIVGCFGTGIGLSIYQNLSVDLAENSMQQIFGQIGRLFFTWIIFISASIFLSFLLLWLASRCFDTVKRDLLLRRRIIVCLSLAAASTAYYLIEGWSFEILAFALLLLVFFAMDGRKRPRNSTTSGESIVSEEMKQESVILGNDIAIFRFLERLCGSILFAFCYAALQGGAILEINTITGKTDSGTVMMAAICAAPIAIYRLIGEQQGREIALQKVLSGE